MCRKQERVSVTFRCFIAASWLRLHLFLCQTTWKVKLHLQPLVVGFSVYAAAPRNSRCGSQFEMCAVFTVCFGRSGRSAEVRRRPEPHARASPGWPVISRRVGVVVILIWYHALSSPADVSLAPVSSSKDRACSLRWWFLWDLKHNVLWGDAGETSTKEETKSRMALLTCVHYVDKIGR